MGVAVGDRVAQATARTDRTWTGTGTGSRTQATAPYERHDEDRDGGASQALAWGMSTRPDPEQTSEQNRHSWNRATAAHNAHKADQAGFLRDGGTTLFAEELELLGDLRGVELAHLQCNSGQDSLSLASRGARVTGIDISDEAIDFASTLSRDSGIPASFVRSELVQWLETSLRTYDLAFSSYGTICWMSDLRRWAEDQMPEPILPPSNIDEITGKKEPSRAMKIFNIVKEKAQEKMKDLDVQKKMEDVQEKAQGLRRGGE